MNSYKIHTIVKKGVLKFKLTKNVVLNSYSSIKVKI